MIFNVTTITIDPDTPVKVLLTNESYSLWCIILTRYHSLEDAMMPE